MIGTIEWDSKSRLDVRPTSWIENMIEIYFVQSTGIEASCVDFYNKIEIFVITVAVGFV